MAFLFEAVVEALMDAFLRVTGELVRWAATLGRHRVRWRTPDDEDTWPSVLLGLAFWGALVLLLGRVL